MPKSSNGIFRKSHVAKVNGVGNLAIPTDVGWFRYSLSNETSIPRAHCPTQTPSLRLYCRHPDPHLHSRLFPSTRPIRCATLFARETSVLRVTPTHSWSVSNTKAWIMKIQYPQVFCWGTPWLNMKVASIQWKKVAWNERTYWKRSLINNSFPGDNILMGNTVVCCEGNQWWRLRGNAQRSLCLSLSKLKFEKRLPDRASSLMCCNWQPLVARHAAVWRI